MNEWAVLGSGAPLRSLGRRLADRSGPVHVVTPDESDTDGVREAGVAVTVGDPTDRDVLGDLEGVRGVLVAVPEPERATACVRAAREAHPGVPLVVYLGDGTERWERVAAIADRVVDPGEVAADYLLERVSEKGTRMRQLRQVLHGTDRLAVVTHDNPDPDAIASAVALERIATASGCEAEVYYYGDINHQENRALVNLLEFDLTNLPPDDVPGAEGIALVDHSRPGVNNGLPEETEVDIVIDHHPPRVPVDARYVDLRSDAGATSTLLVDYLDQFGMTPGTDVATGLLFGIRTDTDEFTRGVAPMDFDAAAWLLPGAELGMLERIESPSISPETFETIAAAIRNRNRDGDVLLSCVGNLPDRDALAQAADRLVGLEGVSTVVVYGMREGTVYVSARSRGSDLDLGEVLRDAFGRIGSAGGHADMAGAQIALGVLEDVDDEESLADVVEEFVTKRFFEAMDVVPTQSLAAVTGESRVAEEYLLPEDEHPDTDEEA